MIAEWAGASYVIALAIGLLFAPGLALLAVVRLRGLALVALAPLMSVAMIAVAALILDFAGIGWSPIALGVALLVMIAAGMVVRVVASVPRDSSSQRGWILPVSIAIGAIFSVWRLAAYIQSPEGISQTNDAIFHLNAVRYILETHSASALDVSGFIGGRGFYPAAWHAVTSMLVLLSGSDIPVAANAVALVIGAVIWPLGIAWLARVVFRSDTVAAVAAVLAGSLHAFPLLMFQWGVLYPNALSTALLPAAIAVVLSIPTWIRQRPGWRTWLLSGLLTMVAFGAIAVSQPATLLAWGLIVAIWLTALIARSGVPVVTKVTTITLAWGALAVLWYALSHSTSGSHWSPFRGRLQAGLDIVTNGHMFMVPAIAVSVFMLVGLVAAAMTARHRWILFAWLAVSALYFVAATVGRHFVRVELLGAWYADPYRISSLTPVIVIPVAAYGLTVVVRKASALWAARAEKEPSEQVIARVAVSVAALVMIVIVMFRPSAMPDYEGNFEDESLYAQDDSTFLSTDERQLLESLDELLPADALVIANPSTGSAFGYLFSGIDVIPKTWSPPKNEAWWLLAESLRDAGTDPAVCESLALFGQPGYVLDFGMGGIEAGRYEMPGMTDFEGQPGFTEVAAVGDASVWRITACAE